MKVLSVSGFSEWQKEAGVREFVFDSDNNDWLTPCFHTCLRFPTAAVSRSSGRISFRNGKAHMSFERVKEVRLYDDIGCIGTVFDILCETPGGRPVIWRFLAD